MGLQRYWDSGDGLRGTSLATAQEGASGVKSYFPGGETLARISCNPGSILETTLWCSLGLTPKEVWSGIMEILVYFLVKGCKHHPMGNDVPPLQSVKLS